MRPVFADPKEEGCEARERDRIARQDARGALTQAHRLGLERGRREGKAEGLAAQQAAIENFCEVLGVALDEGRRAQLLSLDLEELSALRTHLKTHKTCPASGG